MADAADGSVARDPRAWEHIRQLAPMQGMGNFRLGRRTVMYTVETIPKGKNRVLGGPRSRNEVWCQEGEQEMIRLTHNFRIALCYEDWALSSVSGLGQQKNEQPKIKD
ncbi:hypothetical protein Chor_016231 [Crotalus horridus]